MVGIQTAEEVRILEISYFPKPDKRENMFFCWTMFRQSVLCLSAAPNKENEEQKAKKERKNRKKKKIYWKNIELLDMDYD